MKYNFCKNCGSPIQPGFTNCQRCGAPAEQVQAVNENKPMDQPAGMLKQYYDPNGTMQPVNNVQQQPVQQPMPQQPPMGAPMGQPMQQPMMQGQPVPQANNADDGSFLWALVGFLFTLIGLILYFLWKDTKPKNAKMAGMGALVGAIASAIMYATGIIRFGL